MSRVRSSSSALVSEDGLHLFYAERDPMPAAASEFAREAVYPLLDRGRTAMSDQAMTMALRRFLASLPTPCVLADYPNDFNLLRRALAGFELPDDEAASCGSFPRLNNACYATV